LNEEEVDGRGKFVDLGVSIIPSGVGTEIGGLRSVGDNGGRSTNWLLPSTFSSFNSTTTDLPPLTSRCS